LSPGPQLFIDNYLIASQSGLGRSIHSPQKVSTPLINGADNYHNCAPYATVLRNPATGQYRMWYDANIDGTNYLVSTTSNDGINWDQPYQTLMNIAASGYGASVIDDGPSNPAARYKYVWYSAVEPKGLHVATSSDGLTWNPVSSNAVVSATQMEDIISIYHDQLRGLYIMPGKLITSGTTWTGDRRIVVQTAGTDLLHWQTPWRTITPDAHDAGKTEFYSMSGIVERGGLLVGLLKVLRDDIVAEGAPTETPPGALPAPVGGIGYTVLTWSRDGVHWERDSEPFLDRSPIAGDWDHAMAWGDSQLTVGDQTYVYYAGYRWGHKWDRYHDRQIGMATMTKDRYVSRDAGDAQGTLLTSLFTMSGNGLSVNADVRGSLDMRILDADGSPLAGFGWSDFQTIHGDSIAHAAKWAGDLSGLKGAPVQLEFRLVDGSLYGFEITSVPEPSAMTMLCTLGLACAAGSVAQRAKWRLLRRPGHIDGQLIGKRS
jgi:hypothetical protein